MNDAEIIRAEFDALLRQDPQLSLSLVARKIGFSKGTVCRFRKGIYTGNNELIAAKIAEYIGSHRIAQKQISGELKQIWIVRTSTDNIKLVRTRRALDKALAATPEAHVITMWLGMQDIRDVFFSTGSLPHE